MSAKCTKNVFDASCYSVVLSLVSAHLFIYLHQSVYIHLSKSACMNVCMHVFRTGSAEHI